MVLVALVFSKLFIYSTSPAEENKVAMQIHSPAADTEVLRNDVYFTSLSFASEMLPLGDPGIEKRMMRYLRAHAYTRLGNHQLHRKAEKWFPVVTPILRRYGIPEDFRYLPLIESGFETGTSSHRGASGYWQFMPHTARSFGLKVNGQTDERQHIRKSTEAACRYLRALYKEFNSWTLVAAAFNMGEGNLKRAISRQDEDNYFRLKLNRETSSYMYKLIAVKEIIEHPKRHGYRSEYGTMLARLDEAEETAASSGNL